MSRIKVDWSRQITTDVNPALKKFERWPNEHGYRDECIDYIGSPEGHEYPNLWVEDEAKPRFFF